MWDTFDKRKFPRLKIKCDVFFKQQNSEEDFATETENIGAGGVCVYLEQPLPSFTPVSLKLDLQDKNYPVTAIECLGKVVWCIKHQMLNHDKPRYDIGIEFLNLPSEDRERIRQFIQERLPQ